jgi:GH15 family glucan-1,4-alpha-glucosidase
VRNWDYRYTWIRDTAATLWALYALGFDWEANDFFHFVADVAAAEGGDLQIMYGVHGERALQESTLDHLSGYDDARPVRVGNAAYTQRQHDVWGAVVGAIDLYTRAHERVDDRLWVIVQTQVQRALEHWREPDQGIWEVRSEPQHFTFSKVACWVAADAGAAARRGPLREEAGRVAYRGERSAPTCSPTPSTSEASSPSTTAARRSTRRCC